MSTEFQYVAQPTSPPPPRRSRRRRVLATSGVVMLLAVVSSMLILTTTGKSVSNVFSNVSNGLNVGGGLAVQAPNAQPAGADQSAAHPAYAQNLTASSGNPNASNLVATDPNLVLGNPPGYVERTVEASYRVPHDKFLTSFNQLIAHAVTDEGGFVVSSSTSPDASGRMVSGTVVLKVPTAKLATFLSGLANNTFTPGSINFATIDHSAEYIDDQARFQEAQQSLAALQRALANTSDAGQVTSLTQQIQAAQADLEQKQATFAVVTQAVGMSTATIHLQESGATAATPAPPQTALVSSTTGGLNNDLAIASGLIYAILTALPVLLILVIVGLMRRRLMGWAKALVS